MTQLEFVLCLYIVLNDVFCSFECTGWYDSDSPLVYSVLASRTDTGDRKDVYVLYYGSSNSYEVLHLTYCEMVFIFIVCIFRHTCHSENLSITIKSTLQFWSWINLVLVQLD